MDSKLIWIIFAGIGIATLAKSPSKSSHSASTDAASSNIEKHQSYAPEQHKREMSTGGGFVIERSPDGHFYADGQVNGVTVRFLIDSGATSVALTKEDAARIGKHVSQGDMTIKVQTANGEVGVAPVKLDSVALGSVTVNQVDAVVAGEGLNISLLGQSYLARIGKVNIENDRMTLN